MTWESCVPCRIECRSFWGCSYELCLVDSSSGQHGQVIREHFFPDRPVVVTVCADVQLMVDAFGQEQPAHRFILAAADVAVGGPQDDHHIPKCGIAIIG